MLISRSIIGYLFLALILTACQSMKGNRSVAGRGSNSLDDIDRGFVSATYQLVYLAEGLPKDIISQIAPIANPGEPYNRSDLMQEGLPSRQIIYGGTSSEFIFVLYDQGGFVPRRRLVVFRRADSGNVILRGYDLRLDVDEFQNLKDTIRTGGWVAKGGL